MNRLKKSSWSFNGSYRERLLELMARFKVRRHGKGSNCLRIYMVAPHHPESFWSLQGTVELFGAKTLMPNAALPTLMALTPEDVSVEYVLCDENVSKIELDMPSDLVVVTGSTLHASRIREICAAFRSKAVPVALGGTYASINPDQCRGLADYLFIGEAEYTWPKFLRQLAKASADPVYVQETYVDMKDSPPPDWSLIKPGDYLNMCVQTSRGCPNRCDFCDVIQYVGSKYRTKSVEQVLREVQNAHALGARTVFFSDDNFLGNKAFTMELLSELIQWNTAQTRPLSFSTQITVQVADDVELLRMFADARFSVLFLGVETVRKESLEEVHKVQNLKQDIRERVGRISRYGIVPFIGLIVGFDNDDALVFDELYRFITDTCSPIAGISLLNAPRHTPLYKRLDMEGRLVGEDFSGEWQLYTNIIPKQMSREELIERYWDLFQKIYDPELFSRRLEGWLKQVEYFSTIYVNRKADLKQLFNIYMMLRYFLFRASPDVRSLFFRNLKRTWRLNPRLMRRTFTLLAQYRHFYDFVRKPRKLS